MLGNGELLRSTDAGQHFRRVAAPPLPSQGTAPTLVFANSRDGFAYVPCGTGPLYVTHDAGASWHRAGPAGGVLALATGGGDAYVVTTGAGLERSPASHDAWSRLGFHVRTPYPFGLAARGSHVWFIGPPRGRIDRTTIAISSDRGRTFSTRKGPCFYGLPGRPVPAGGGVVWAVCSSGMMAAVFRSTDGGRSFVNAHAPPVTNGAQLFPVSAHAAFLDGGGDGPLFRTEDGGRHWARLRLPFRIVQLEWAQFTTPRVGAALVEAGSHARLWRTTSGGASWRSVPLR